jgi:replicative DNA helicase
MFSLEMPVAGIAERYNEIIHGASGRDIEEIYYNDDTNYIREPLEKQFKESLKNLFIVPTKVSANDIIRYIPLIEHHYKLKIGVIGIDYLGLMDGPGKSTYEIISNIAKDVKVKIAKRLNLPVVLLAQVSRNQGGSGTQELYLESGRDSGAIEESADFILGFWQQEKEAEDAEEQSFDLICKILKNRKGPKNSCWKLDINEVNLRLGSTATRYILNDKNDKKDKQNGF